MARNQVTWDYMKRFKHPVQPVVMDDHGVHRYKENAIVSYLLDKLPDGLNTLAMMNVFSDEDFEQLAQLIGYSVSGANDLNFVSDRVAEVGLARSAKLTEKGFTRAKRFK